MRKLILSISILLCFVAVSSAGPLQRAHMAVLSQYNSGGSSPPATCGILNYNAEGYSDGDNLTTAGWTGDNTDDIEIDTSQYHSGSASIQMAMVGSGSSSCEKTYSAQSGQHYVSFWLRAGGTDPTHTLFYPVSFYSSTTEILYFKIDDASVSVSDVSSLVDTTFDITADTWHNFVFVIDASSDTYTVFIDGSQYLSGETLDLETAVSDADGIHISNYIERSTAYVWLDDFCIQSGGYTP